MLKLKSGEQLRNPCGVRGQPRTEQTTDR